MEIVPNASTMTRDEAKKLLRKGSGYFVHRDGELLGIGSVDGNIVETVIAVKRGAGADVLLTLCDALFSETVILEVASANAPAVSLYERLGFQKTAEISRWYEIDK